MAIESSLPVAVDNVTIQSNPVAVKQPTTGANAARTINTAYQNTSGKIMYVVVTITASTATQIYLGIGSTSAATDVQLGVINNPVASFLYPFYAVVPNNWYYKPFATGGAATIAQASEQY